LKEGFKVLMELKKRLPDVKDLVAAYPDVQWRKYLDHDEQVRRKANNCRRLGLHHSQTLQILDIGCGSGIFLFCAGHYGHKGLGIDVENPLLEELARRYGVARCVAPVRRREPINVQGPFDLVTAMNIAFDRDQEGARWSERDWAFFIDEIRRKLTEDGRSHLRLGIERGSLRQSLGQVLSRFAIRQRIRPGKKAEFTLSRIGLGHVAKRLWNDYVWGCIWITQMVSVLSTA
jgi:SAM-dependent methyltransferase